MKIFYIIMAVSLLLFSCGRQQTTPPQPFGACPNAAQVEWQRMEMNMFCHFGPNTFSNKEWGSGKEPASLFNPTALDCRQWVTTARNSGMHGIIITAKHHDGFCLWPSSQSIHTVAYSPWRNGQGDLLKELRQACDEQKMPMGVYISPWDRNHPSYGTPDYNTVFAATLLEVHQGYGPLYEQWFDGANGEEPNGKKQDYDWSLFHHSVNACNPACILFSDVGPGCRWVGNEDGSAATTCWSTLNSDGFFPGSGAPPLDSLRQGNRNGAHWIPAEADVSIRPGWFWHADEQPKTVQELLQIYYNSVGRNALLLLNVPPDTSGRIDTRDSLRLMEFRAALNSIFSNDMAQQASITATRQRGGKRCKKYRPENMLDTAYHSYWTTDEDWCADSSSATITLTFRKPVTFNRVILQEYIPLGQRVDSIHIEYMSDGQWRQLQTATTIGYKRILLTDVVTTDNLRIVIDHSLAPPILNRIALFMDSVMLEP